MTIVKFDELGVMRCDDCNGQVVKGVPHTCWKPAGSTQIGGDHYKKRAMQPWDFIAANNIGFFEGNAIKYIVRWKDKGGVEDLKKAKHYIDKLIELQGGQA